MTTLKRWQTGFGGAMDVVVGPPLLSGTQATPGVTCATAFIEAPMIRFESWRAKATGGEEWKVESRKLKGGWDPGRMRARESRTSKLKSELKVEVVMRRSHSRP